MFICQRDPPLLSSPKREDAAVKPNRLVVSHYHVKMVRYEGLSFTVLYRNATNVGFYSRVFTLINLCQVLVGCNHAPSQNILGSFFPAWMLCATAGLLLTLVIRQIVIRCGIDGFVPAKLPVYTGLTISLTFILWLGWFGN
jgi:hypothetical protein